MALYMALAIGQALTPPVALAAFVCGAWWLYHPTGGAR